VWEAYGGFLIQFTLETGWDELLRAMAQDLEVHQLIKKSSTNIYFRDSWTV
jgi:hypothetical protein